VHLENRPSFHVAKGFKETEERSLEHYFKGIIGNLKTKEAPNGNA